MRRISVPYARAFLYAAVCGAVLAAGVGRADAGGEPIETPAYREMVRADQLRDAGRTRSALSRYRAAVRLFEELQRDYPDYKPATIEYRLDYCRTQIGRLESGELEREDEPDYEALAQAAQAEAGRWQAEAERLSARVLELESAPEDPQIARQAARIRELESDLARAERRIGQLERQTRRRDPDPPPPAETPGPVVAETPEPVPEPEMPVRDIEADVQAAEQALASGDAATARERFEAILAEDPSAHPGGGLFRRLPRGGDPRVRAGLVQALLGEGDLREASRVARSLAREYPENAVFAHLEGIIARGQGREAVAARHFARAVEQAPRDLRYRFDMATSLHAAGRREEAVEQYRALLAMDPEHSLAHFNLASLLSGAGAEERDSARAHYQQALALGEAPDPRIEQRLQAEPAE